MQRLRRFARYWDLIGNSGRFVQTTPLLWRPSGSPFAGFLHWSDWLYERIGRQHSIALDRLAELLFEFLTREAGLEANLVAGVMWRDYQRTGRRDTPPFLRSRIAGEASNQGMVPAATGLRRQARHRSLGGSALADDHDQAECRRRDP